MRLDFNPSSLLDLFFKSKYSRNILRSLLFSSSMILNPRIYKLYSRYRASTASFYSW